MTDPAKPATLADVERLETMRAGDDELMYRFQLSIDAPALFAAVRELERDRQDEEAIYELCWEICNEVRSSSLHIAGSTTTLDPEHVRFEHQANGADECAYKILAAKNAAVRVPLNDTGADDQGSSCEPVHAAPQGQLNESSGRQEQQCAKGMAPVAEPAAPAGSPDSRPGGSAREPGTVEQIELDYTLLDHFLAQWAAVADRPHLRSRLQALRSFALRPAAREKDRQDAERIDWLQSLADHHPCIDIFPQCTEIQVVDSPPGDGTHTIAKGVTLRDAIDRAAGAKGG